MYEDSVQFYVWQSGIADTVPTSCPRVDDGMVSWTRRGTRLTVSVRSIVDIGEISSLKKVRSGAPERRVTVSSFTFQKSRGKTRPSQSCRLNHHTGLMHWFPSTTSYWILRFSATVAAQMDKSFIFPRHSTASRSHSFGFSPFGTADGRRRQVLVTISRSFDFFYFRPCRVNY